MTIQNITMPQLGESVTEGTIEKWLIKPGDQVKKYDALAEVQTDKVTAELPSSFTGTISELIAHEGDTIEVGKIVCTIEIEDAVVNPPTVTTHSKESSNEDQNTNTSNEKSMKTRYSPAVVRLASEHQIDLTQVEGSGASGRITRKDIQKIIETGNIPKATKQKVEQPNIATQQVIPEVKLTNHIETQPSSIGDIEIPVSGVRRAIAKNMVMSTQEIPHAWMMMEVDVTDLVSYRDSIKEDFKKKEGYNLTYFAFFVKAVSQALKEFPMMNSQWQGDKIIQKKDINLSIAVTTEDALYVPVIHHADDKSIKGIAKEVHELAIKVRSGKLKSEDMQGGTFTVNNTGSFGSVQSMGIINYPQAAILQIESIVKRPVIMNGGMFAARDMVNICLSIDHRILDGFVSGKFLARVKEILENISKDTTSIY
ncbi:MAG: dihydrolipoamide acetyltransferase family protein [Rummeliibacillus sp.]|uniref:dihydrolipoamide acetyltransferase family protein n=1 Tax=Rummeliibacillus sp. POC4 TaxID=2305899 RepID=UPI000E65F97A|nr:dihydrolipoamide acetyltransferase family protein [Rummeliibacillus sp. POC4]RIJ67061.1 2-oxo acid dehydrogenase subunit E2 [Rummeliibacillus sp. POC4]